MAVLHGVLFRRRHSLPDLSRRKDELIRPLPRVQAYAALPPEFFLPEPAAPGKIRQRNRKLQRRDPFRAAVRTKGFRPCGKHHARLPRHPAEQLLPVPGAAQPRRIKAADHREGPVNPAFPQRVPQKLLVFLFQNTDVHRKDAALPALAELQNLALGQANVILQVTNKKAVKDKYKVAVIKRPVEFSKETYNKAYNDFSEFIAANSTVEKLVANAEDAGYRLLDRRDLASTEHTIGGVRGTKDALRWAFSAKPGEVSGLYECGESDHMMVVGLVSVVPEGYRPMALVRNELRAEVLRDKKAEKIMADMKNAGATTLAQYADMSNAVQDSVKLVTFAAPAYVSALGSSEPLVCAYASVGEMNQLSAPVKGVAGVFVLQPYAKEKINETYDQKTEENAQASLYMRMASQFMSDLYLKAEVKDTRYLFF